MFSSRTTFLGIDPTAGQRPFTYAALDIDLRLLALGEGTMEDVLAFTAGQRSAVVAISAPRRPNLGLLQQDEVRQGLHPMPRPGRWSGFRVAEYQLRQHQIGVPQTPGVEESCPRWMQMGFKFYRRLESLGYISYPAEVSTSAAEVDGSQSPETGGALQYLEVYPHACYTALLGVTPFPKVSLEGRIQRQLVLHEQQVHVPDAMDFFEEITRHRLLKGILPLETLYSPGELDALVAAYTAYLAANQPEQVSCIGHPQEGQIILPVPELKERYT